MSARLPMPPAALLLTADTPTFATRQTEDGSAGRACQSHDDHRRKDKRSLLSCGIAAGLTDACPRRGCGWRKDRFCTRSTRPRPTRTAIRREVRLPRELGLARPAGVRAASSTGQMSCAHGTLGALRLPAAGARGDTRRPSVASDS